MGFVAFYLIYVDDFGNSGGRLDDPQQPLFSLQAALVPVDDGAWMRIERAQVELLDKIKDRLNLSVPPRLHAVDFYQRTGHLRGATIEECFGWIEDVLRASSENGVKYVATEIEKRSIFEPLQKLAEPFENLKRESPAFKELIELFSQRKVDYIYELSFIGLIFLLNRILEKMDSYGMIIHDQHGDLEVLSRLKIYRAFKSQGIISRIIENPIYKDSRIHSMLATADFAGYVRGGMKVDALKGKSRPMLSAWNSLYIEPNIIQSTQSDFDASTSKDIIGIGVFLLHSILRETSGEYAFIDSKQLQDWLKLSVSLHEKYIEHTKNQPAPEIVQGVTPGESQV